jgi:hypothetical protein
VYSGRYIGYIFKGNRPRPGVVIASEQGGIVNLFITEQYLSLEAEHDLTMPVKT